MTIRVGNAPVSWGVYGPDDRANPPFGTVLDMIAEAGYSGTELGPYGYMPTEPEALRAELARRGLGLGSSYVGVPFADASKRADSVAEAVKVARFLATQGVRDVMLADSGSLRREAIAGRVPDRGEGWDDAAWKNAGATLDAIARAVGGELGMKVVVHHHVGTFVETPAEIDRLLSETDAGAVGLLLDTGHAVYGGADPLDVLRRHGDRVRYIHLKDVARDEMDRVRSTDIGMRDAWKRGVFCALGEGVVDFPRLVEELKSRRYSGWAIVEQDVVPSADGKLVPEPFACAKKSRAYLREKVGI